MVIVGARADDFSVDDVGQDIPDPERDEVFATGRLMSHAGPRLDRASGN